MATRITDVSSVPYQSSGVYFREVDLTVITQSVGTFSAGSIGLTERGPAFSIKSSSTYSERAFNFGELNPSFPSSYFAKQYLEQGANYKEIRLLGIEGYSDTVAFAIVYNIGGSAAAVPGVSALVLAPSALACVLKKRPTSHTGRLAVSKVEVQTTTYTDPVSALSVTSATDYLFGLKITYSDSTNETIVCSLRPESDQYIVKKFGTDPLDSSKVLGLNASLWVDFIIPSTVSRPDLEHSLGYYVPGSSTTSGTLTLLTGNMAFGTSVNFQSTAITNVVTTGSIVTVTVASDITSWLTNGSTVTIANVSGTGNITQANGTWLAKSVVFSSPNTTFKLTNSSTNVDLTITGGTTFNGASSPTITKTYVPIWESALLNFGGVGYQTPLTPWFVSDADLNGDYTNLFRFWAISDGKSANTEAKIEIKNINPAGNNGTGSFDVIVRNWSDRDDTAIQPLESFTGLSLDPLNNKYIASVIGDGDTYNNNSNFIFVEMNDTVDLTGMLPYGCTGYPNVSSLVVDDLPFTLEYDLTKPVTKQNLGLTNNVINSYGTVAPDYLSFKRSTGVYGKGFHLNPSNNTAFVTAQASNFYFANQTVFKNTAGTAYLSASDQVARTKFVVDFFGGFDGWNVYSQRTWGDTSSNDYAALSMAIDLFSDKEAIDSDFTILVTPDLNMSDHQSACEAVNDMVVGRGDALYIPDFAYDAAADVNVASTTLAGTNLNTNSTAVYFPHVQLQDPINIKPIWMPPSVIALGTITYVANNENIWQPPAGSIRTVTNNLIKTRRRLKLADREILKTSSINPITFFPGSGYEITEARTTQLDFSALSFIHNRLLLCYAKKVLNQTLRPLLFQLNGTVTENAFLNTVRPIFDRIKKLNGIEDYSVTVISSDTTTDRTTLQGNITIIPLYALEKIEVTFTLENGALNFNQ